MGARILELDGTPVKNFSNPDRKVKWFKKDIYGDWVYGSLRTIAHLDQTSKRAAKRFGNEIEVFQGAYNDDVAASAGTHDKDAVLDVFIPNISWKAMQRFLRAQGWAAWWRYPPSFGNHIHMISLGYTMPVGEFVPGQVDDYYAHRDGLAGHAHDGTWHPDNIKATVFDFEQWEKEMDTLDAEDRKWVNEQLAKTEERIIAAFNRALSELPDDVSKEVLSSTVNKDGATVRASLRASLAHATSDKAVTDAETP